MFMIIVAALLFVVSEAAGEEAFSVLSGCLQDDNDDTELSKELSPPEVKARIDAMLSGGELLPRSELVATVKAAGEMPGMGFWDDLFTLAGRVSFPHTLDCYLAAFRLRGRESASRVVSEIEQVASSKDVDRLCWAVRVLGLHPELGVTENLVDAIEKAESRGRQDPLDKDWSLNIRALASQGVFATNVSRLYKKFSQAVTVDAKLRILIRNYVLSDTRQCLEYGMALEGGWSQQAFRALAQEQPDSVASWVFKLSVVRLEDDEWPPGVDRTPEALEEYRQKLAELLPPDSARVFESLSK